MRHSRISVVFFRILVEDEDSLLLLRHPKWGDWGLPGGHIETGESPLEAALRELREELPIDRARVGLNVLSLRDQPIKWGPVHSRSAAGALTEYSTWYFAGQFSSDPRALFAHIDRDDTVFFPLRLLNPAAWPENVTDQLSRFAAAQPDGLSKIPASWPAPLEVSALGLRNWSDAPSGLAHAQSSQSTRLAST